MQNRHKNPLLLFNEDKTAVNPEQTEQEATLLKVVQLESWAEFRSQFEIPQHEI